MAERIRRAGKSKAGGQARSGKGPGGGGHLTYVLLVLAAGVVGLTLYVAFAPSEPAETPQDKSAASPLHARILDEARRAMEKGLFSLARDLMATYVKRYPDDVNVRPLLAEAQLNLGKVDEAEVTTDDLLELAPQSAKGLWLKGQIAGLRGRDGYMEYFRRAAESPQAGPEIWSRYGRALLAARKHAACEAYLRRALEAGAKGPPTLFALGEVSLALDKYDEAERYLREGLRVERRQARAWHLLASAQSAAGRHAAAEQSVQEALQVCRGDERPGLLMQLGAVRWLRPERKQAAAETYVEAMRYPDVRAEAAYRAARCYYVLDRPALAMKYGDIAASLPGAGRREEALLAKIEDARFGRPEPATQPSGLPPFGVRSWGLDLPAEGPKTPDGER